MFKEPIVKALKWALNKLEPTPTPTLDDKLKAWPFPVEASKAKPRVAKATTRKPVVKKTVKKVK